MSFFRSLRTSGALGAAVCLLFPVNLRAELSAASIFTLEDLLAEQLAPREFARLFEHFDYDFSPLVLPAKVFLGTRRGDCDDYAILADYVLSRKSYETRIVRVGLVGESVAHAVCYVTESKAYLDFNNRQYFIKLTRSGQSLREIATKVAASFEQNWTTATEYTYSYETDRKTARMTVVKTDPPARDPDAGRK